jgi:chromosome segregation ATPase
MPDRPTTAAEQFADRFRAEWEQLNASKSALRDKHKIVSEEITSLIAKIAKQAQEISGIETSVSDLALTYGFKNKRLRQSQTIKNRLGNLLVEVDLLDDRAIYKDNDYSTADPRPLLLAIASKAAEHFINQLPRT